MHTVAPVDPKEQGGQQKPPAPPENANVTPQPREDNIIHQEERIEYRDQDGNLLDESQLESLSGAVSFRTRYETRTRVVDAAGNFIREEPAVEGVAPPHPDVQGRNPETAGGADVTAGRTDKPATADAKEDTEKERSVEQEKNKEGKPRPGSEGNQATK